MYHLVVQIGYKFVNTRLGQIMLRRNPVGRAIVRRVGSLSRMLPLRAPQSVMIDICNVCNFKCKFCPTGDRELLNSVGRPKGVMNLSLFRKIVDDLKAFNGNIAVLAFHKDGEPLLNKQVVEMIRYAKAAKVAATTEITTNGSRLFPKLSDQLFEAELDCIRISVEHVSSSGYKETVRTFDDYDLIVQNVSYLFHERNRRGSKLKILAKIINTGLSQDEVKKFYRDFSPISDIARVEGIMGWSHSNVKDFTLGLSPKVGMDGITPLKVDRIVCPEPFKMLAVNFNGAVSPCCDDWAHSLIVGDANMEDVYSVWNGSRMNELRRTHLESRRSELPACANCQYMLGVTDLFDLDAGRDGLLKHYQVTKLVDLPVVAS